MLLSWEVVSVDFPVSQRQDEDQDEDEVKDEKVEKQETVEKRLSEKERKKERSAGRSKGPHTRNNRSNRIEWNGTGSVQFFFRE